jgi:ankyrin repeat protein
MQQGRAALHWAAKEGHPEAAAALLIAGADIHAIDRKVLGIQVYKPCVRVQSLLQWIEKLFFAYNVIVIGCTMFCIP